MSGCNLGVEEKEKRREIAVYTRRMAAEQLSVVDEEEIITVYRGYFLQISFSELHPLMFLCFAKGVKNDFTNRYSMVNRINMESVLGCHVINEEAGCYCYRASQWLDSRLSISRFFEILNRYADEADRGFSEICKTEL